MTAGDQGWGNAPTPQHQAPYSPPPAAGPFIAFGPLLITIAIITLVMLLGNVTQIFGIALVIKKKSNMLELVALVGTAWCGCAMLLDLLGGMLYAFLYKRSHPLDLGRGAAGGAIGGAVTRILVTPIAGLLSPMFLYGASPKELGTFTGVDFGSLVFSTCLWTVGGAALGAIGGLIGGLIWQPK